MYAFSNVPSCAAPVQAGCSPTFLFTRGFHPEGSARPVTVTLLRSGARLISQMSPTAVDPFSRTTPGEGARLFAPTFRDLPRPRETHARNQARARVPLGDPSIRFFLGPMDAQDTR